MEPLSSVRTTSTPTSVFSIHNSLFVRSSRHLGRSLRTGYKLTEIKNRLKYIGIKHITTHFDCCHAGGIFISRGVEATRSEPVLDRLGNAPVVEAITAVTKDEEAIEETSTRNGLFTFVLCDQLWSGKVFDEHSSQPFITGTQLFSTVQRVVVDRADARGAKMTPMREKVLSEHPEGYQCCGEMLFFRT